VAVLSHIYPSFSLNGLKKTLNASTDTLDVLLIASGTYAWNTTSQAHKTVTDFLGGSGAGSLTEVSTSGTGYTRQALTSVTLTNTALVTMLTCANPTWATATLGAVFALFYDNTVGGTDGTNQIMGYWDFGSTQTVTSAPFVISVNAGGLFTWTHS
jgi:hypothetical protein